MNIKFFSIKLFLLLFLCSSAHSGKYPYPEDAEILAKIILGHMVKKNECKAVNNCQNKEFLFRDGGSNLAIIYIYEADELGSSTLTEIIKICSDFFYEKNKKLTVELKIYRETMRESVKWFSGIEPFIYLQLKGEE